MISSSTNQSMIANLCTDMAALCASIKDIEADPKSKKVQGNYFEMLSKISALVHPLFENIQKYCEEAGFEAKLFVAAPRVRVENFVFLVQDPETQEYTHVVLAKNKAKGFLQNGGGKTWVGENFADAAVREAREEFNFSGDRMVPITTESDGGMPVFHFGKGVHVGIVTPEQAGIVSDDEVSLGVESSQKRLKLGDDMTINVMHTMTVAEFLDVTDKDKKPVDHGFDRKFIAKFIREGAVTKEFHERTITIDDIAAAVAFQKWEKNVKYDADLCKSIEKAIQLHCKALNNAGSVKGKWKDKDNRDALRDATQKVVDVIVKKLLPDWTYTVEKKVPLTRMQSIVDVVTRNFYLTWLYSVQQTSEKVQVPATQMKVNEGQAFVMPDGGMLPSFMSGAQYHALRQLKPTFSSLLEKPINIYGDKI